VASDQTTSPSGLGLPLRPSQCPSPAHSLEAQTIRSRDRSWPLTASSTCPWVMMTLLAPSFLQSSTFFSEWVMAVTFAPIAAETDDAHVLCLLAGAVLREGGIDGDSSTEHRCCCGGVETCRDGDSEVRRTSPVVCVASKGL
jgi:hypothetical protein